MVHCTVINGAVTTDGHNHRILLHLPWNVESHKNTSLHSDFWVSIIIIGSASGFPVILLPHPKEY